MKQQFTFLLLLSFLILPTAAFAGVQCPAPIVFNGNGTFDPNGAVPSGYGSGSNSFSGMNFSGVGGALAGCLNVGGSVVSGLSDIFGVSTPGTGGQTVPVKDANSAKSAEELAKANKRAQCLDGVAYSASKTLLQNLSNKTVSWAKTGFNGNPFYVRDIDSYMKSISDDKINTFLSDIPNSEPVFGIAIRSAITQQVTGYRDGRISKIMDTPEAKEYNAFQSDFTQGGWNAFLNPQNNVVGSYFNAVDSLSRKIDSEKQNVREELTQGSGFLSMKKCAEYEVSTIAGNGTSDQASCIADYTSKKAVELKTCDAKTDLILKSGCIQSVTTKYETLLRSCTTLKRSTSNAAQKCLRYETVTPGQLISGQLSEVLKSPVNQLVAADSINEVLGGFFDSFMNRLLTQGVGGLSGTSRIRDSGTGIGANVVTGTNGNTLPGYAEAQSSLGFQNSCSEGYTGDFDISRPQQLRGIIKSQKDYLNRVTDNNIVIRSLVPALGKLDYCLPGPNPTWQTGLQENYNTFLSSFRNETTTSGGLLGIGASSTPHFIADPTLFDKTTGGGQRIRRWEFDGDSTVSVIVTFGGQDFDSFYGFMNGGFATLLANYKNAFVPPQKIIDAFKNTYNTPAEKNLAQGNITDSFKETELLPTYAQIIPTYETFYTASAEETATNVAELEAINAEVLRIVGTAKARYIAERQLAGDPVDMSCIDAAYVVDRTPITGVTRQQSGAVDPDIQKSKDARAYFYSNL
jgi:hypothetical protein